MDQSTAVDLLNKLMEYDGDNDDNNDVPECLDDAFIIPAIDFSETETYKDRADMLMAEVELVGECVLSTDSGHMDDKASGTDDDDDPLYCPEGSLNDSENEESTPGKKETNSEKEQASETEHNINEEQSRGRKRTINKDQWKGNVRKRKRQSGQEYVNSKGNVEPRRKIKTKKDCSGRCKFKCSQEISSNKRHEIFESFWKLNDSEKSVFYGNTTKRNQTKKKSEKSAVRKKYTIQYFFIVDGKPVRVCKEFYLTTLDISQTRISYFHEQVARDGTPKPDRRGKHRKTSVPEDMKEGVRNHIKSFPRIPSHYCRARSSKEFLEPGLSLPMMYNLYVQKCLNENQLPVKEHMYRRIFDTEFNIGFHVPKKDRCDLCAAYEMAEKNGTVTPELTENFNAHLESKNATRAERNSDRSLKDESSATICFDLQHVISSPRANASNLFYKRKLNVFNLTAHSSLSPHAYCCVWHEGIAGRGGNEIASCVIAILERFVENHPNVKHLILWSDSCVPQNRNSIMLTALKDLIVRSDLKTIVQKFCEPGHSSIQEVDSVHSKIEKALKTTEVYSPLSFIRVLKSVGKQPMIVIQMKQNMFFNYHVISKSLKCECIPFTKLKSLKISSDNALQCFFKTSFTGIETTVDLRCRSRSLSHGHLTSPQVQKKATSLSKEKLKDIKSMLKFMPLDDKAYMETLFAKR